MDPIVDEDLVGPTTEDAPPSEAVEDTPPPETTPQEPRESSGNAEVDEARRIQDRREELTRNSAVLAMLGTRGENNNGGMVEDVFAEGDGNFQDLESALSGVSGAEVASSQNVAAVRGQTDGGGREDATIGGVESGGGAGSATASSAPAVRVPTGAISTGSIDMADGEESSAIKEVVRRKSGQVKYCYDQRLKENPNISGRLVVDISIAGGRVASVIIAENTTGDSGLESCVIRKIKTWAFPAEVEDDITLPFALEAN
jgi:hypothetical protein